MTADSLAGSNDNQRWETALKSYDEAIRKHSKTGKRRNGLVQLDKHVRQKIPELVESRRTENAPNGYLTKEDICRIVEWKITRGKFRPLMRFANALTPEQAKETSREALSQSSPDPAAAMSTLTSLKGIGPATASAILSLADPSGQCPFLSDEAMHAFDLVNKAGKLDYTIGNWNKLRELSEAKSDSLNKKSEKEEFQWTPALVERALWADTAMQAAEEYSSRR